MDACPECRFGRAMAQPCSAVKRYAQLRSAVVAIAIALPAAQAALEQMEETSTALHADETGHLHRCLYLLSTKPFRWSCAKGCAVQRAERAETRLARLEEALRVAKRTIRTWSEMGAREPDEHLEEMWLLYQESPEMKQINAAMEGRDG